MNVTLLTSKDYLNQMVMIASTAAKCSRGKMEVDKDPIAHLKRIQKYGHENIFEHINLSFAVKDLSRACLMELERHRHLSLTVESTRYTLHQKVLKGESKFYYPKTYFQRIDVLVDYLHTVLLNNAGTYPLLGNDVLKYLIPECLCTNLVLTANVRALREMIKKRTVPQALQEFRDLCYAIYDAMPVDYNFLFDDCIFDPEDKKENTK